MSDEKTLSNLNKEVTGDEVKAFTVRAIIIGLLGVIFINAFSGFNDDHLRGTMFVGNHLPVSTFFLLSLLLLVYNPIAAFIAGVEKREKYLLSTPELAVITGMFFTGSWTPTSGLFRYFHRQLILPWFKLPSKTQWINQNLLGYLPEKLFPAPGPEATGKLHDEVYSGFLNGLSVGNETLWPWDIPHVLKAWVHPVGAFWFPLLICFSVALIGLALMVHRQWSRHEQLSYPLAQITHSVIDRKAGRILPELFSSKLFLYALVFVLSVQIWRLTHAWFPSLIPDIKLTWFFGWTNVFSSLSQARGGSVNTGHFFFFMIGVSYFLASEISLTIGVSEIILAVIFFQVYAITGNPVTDANMEVVRGGGYIGYAIILFYTGRHYYWAILKKALGVEVHTEEERAATWATRLFLAGFAGFVFMLIIMGLDWFLAILFAGLTMLLFLVFSRVVCETGIPFLQAGWLPGTLLADIFGVAAIGAGPLVFIYWMGTILAQDPRECLMPFVANSLKITEDAKVKLLGFIKVAIVVCIIALGVGFVAKCMNCYNYGAAEDSFAFNSVPVYCFDRAANNISFMEGTGQLEEANATHGLAKIKLIAFDKEKMGYLSFGLLGVIIFAFLRFRFSKWPLHPLLFLIWHTYPSTTVFYCFLIGWAIKELIVRFGGGRVYNQLKPFFIGLIMGDLLATIIGVLIGVIYYLSTGLNPVGFFVFPR